MLGLLSNTFAIFDKLGVPFFFLNVSANKCSFKLDFLHYLLKNCKYL
ncbi:hypothetical protein [Spiroplasma poulsonii]|nr:hypothetical protein [Spiroplasma poulsonii]